MPGLLRGVARTAVIAGTATAVSNRVSRRQGGRWAQQEAQQQQAQQAQQAQQQAPPPPPPPAAPPADDMTAKIEQLKQLSTLKEQGVLTEAEFAEQKRRLLG
ncbi:SHOCT domain-containing protein [Streptomyces sp. NPDC089795]|uniref:SHOCT domain-containing protein n=1 Tax=Streptomyces sp. NPDC089795 TaxID=3155297 RepID=UPI0034225893